LRHLPQIEQARLRIVVVGGAESGLRGKRFLAVCAVHGLARCPLEFVAKSIGSGKRDFLGHDVLACRRPYREKKSAQKGLFVLEALRAACPWFTRSRGFPEVLVATGGRIYYTGPKIQLIWRAAAMRC